MRAMQIVGALLVAAGLFIMIKSPSYSSEKSVLKVAGLEAKVNDNTKFQPGPAARRLPQAWCWWSWGFASASQLVSCLRSARSSRRRAVVVLG
jgi:F420-0:gamma-glutamyl ligase-like protein